MTRPLLVRRGVQLVVAGREYMVSLTGDVSTAVGPTEVGSAEVGFADVSSAGDDPVTFEGVGRAGVFSLSLVKFFVICSLSMWGVWGSLALWLAMPVEYGWRCGVGCLDK